MKFEFQDPQIQVKLKNGQKVHVEALVHEKGQYIILINYYDELSLRRNPGIDRKYFYRQEYQPLSAFDGSALLPILHKLTEHHKMLQLVDHLPYQRISKAGTWSNGIFKQYAAAANRNCTEMNNTVKQLEEITEVDPCASDEEKESLQELLSLTREVTAKYCDILYHLDVLGVRTYYSHD